jgi:hypothetical protein
LSGSFLRFYVIVSIMKLTPEQCRAARSLLNWTQENLAVNSGLGVWIIEEFESQNQLLSDSIIDAIQNAFEIAGIEFIASMHPGSQIVKFRE